jgi:type IV pilus assembly protein PilV
MMRKTQPAGLHQADVPPRTARGFTLLEVLVTLVILAFGLLGLASLQAKVHVVELESYQRAQAVLLLEDMTNRIRANRASAANYVTGNAAPLGEGETAACAVSPATPVSIDQCQWSTALKGAAEQRDLNADGDFDDAGERQGAMVGARGCIEQLQAPVGSPSCTPGIYRVTVIWQGMNPTVAPSLQCGQALNAYGGDNMRRAISARVVIGQPGCV